MTKVTYYMYSCDTCCMIRERMEMSGLDCVKCQNPKLRDMEGIIEMFNWIKTKANSVHLLQMKNKSAVSLGFQF